MPRHAPHRHAVKPVLGDQIFIVVAAFEIWIAQDGLGRDLIKRDRPRLRSVCACEYENFIRKFRIFDRVAQRLHAAQAAADNGAGAGDTEAL